MSQRGRFRNSDGGKTVNYKELLDEAEQELEEAEARMAEAAAILAPEVDHERIERVEAKLDALIRALLKPEQVEEVERAIAEGVESGS